MKFEKIIWKNGGVSVYLSKSVSIYLSAIGLTLIDLEEVHHMAKILIIPDGKV